MRVLGNTNFVSTETYAVKGFGNDVIHARAIFGDNDGGTSVIQAKDYQLFKDAVGDTVQNISSGANITLSDADTSFEGKGGTISNGESFLLMAIGINVAQSNVQATEPFTNNAVTSINITPVYRVSPQALVDNLLLHCTFELYRNSDTRLEHGNIQEYPCEYGKFAAAGGGGATVPVLGAGPAQAAYTINPYQYIESAGARFRDLPVYNVFDELDTLYGIFKVNRQIDLASTLLCGAIDFYLVGELNTNISRQQSVYNPIR